MCGEEGHLWQMGACMAKGAVCAEGGVCGGGHAWQGGMHGEGGVYGMHGSGACMVVGGMHGRGYAWWEVCVAGGACVVVRDMHGGGGGCGEDTWQERRLLQRTVRILLECILVFYDFCSFVVPVRNPKTFLPEPGVFVGDIGEKLGYNGVDNGYVCLF